MECIPWLACQSSSQTAVVNSNFLVCVTLFHTCYASPADKPHNLAGSDESYVNIDGLAQDISNSNALEIELSQPRAKPSI